MKYAGARLWPAQQRMIGRYCDATSGARLRRAEFKGTCRSTPTTACSASSTSSMSKISYSARRAEAPEAELRADAVGEIGAVVESIVHAAADLRIPSDHAALREQIHGPERQEADREAEMPSPRSSSFADSARCRLRLAEIHVVRLDAQPVERADARDQFEAVSSPSKSALTEAARSSISTIRLADARAEVDTIVRRDAPRPLEASNKTADASRINLRMIASVKMRRIALHRMLRGRARKLLQTCSAAVDDDRA